MRLSQLIIPLVLIGIAAKLVELGLTRDGVGPFEYLTLAALVAVLVQTAWRLFPLRRGDSRPT